MNKKAIILIVVFVLLLGVGGVFLLLGGEEGSPIDYVIKEGKIIENKNAGLTLEIPEGWQEQKIEDMEGSMIFYTPDIETSNKEKIKPPLTSGCLIETAVVYKKMNFEEIKTEIKDIHEGIGVKSDEFEILEINNHQALKNIFDSLYLGQGIAIYFSTDKLYSFVIYFAPEERDRCSKEFDKFLETVLIE